MSIAGEVPFASDKSIWISDLATATLGPILEGHTGAIWVLAWSPDVSQLASGSKGGAIRVWDVITIECVRILPSSEWIRSIAWSPDSSLFASSSTHASIRVWGTKTCDFMCFNGHKGWVEAVAWSPDGRHLVSGSDDRTVKIWDTTVKFRPTNRGHNEPVQPTA